MPDADVPCSPGDPSDYQALLMTHQMVSCTDDLARSVNVGGRQRDLIVWDEVLLKSEGRHQQLSKLDASHALAARMAELMNAPQPVRDASNYIKRALEAITQRGTNSEAFELDRLTGETLKLYRDSLRAFRTDNAEAKSELLNAG